MSSILNKFTYQKSDFCLKFYEHLFIFYSKKKGSSPLTTKKSIEILANGILVLLI